MRAKCNKTKYVRNSRHRLCCALDCHHSNELAVPNSLPLFRRKIAHPNLARRDACCPAPLLFGAPRFCSPIFLSFFHFPCLSAGFSTTPLLPPVPPPPAPRAPSTLRCPTCPPSPTPSPSPLFIPARTTRARAPPETILPPLADIRTNPSLIRAQADGTRIRATMSRATSFRWVPVETITRNARLVRLPPVLPSRSTVLLALITRKVKMNMLQRNGGRQRTTTRIINLLVQDAYVPSLCLCHDTK